MKYCEICGRALHWYDTNDICYWCMNETNNIAVIEEREKLLKDQEKSDDAVQNARNR